MLMARHISARGGLWPHFPRRAGDAVPSLHRTTSSPVGSLEPPFFSPRLPSVRSVSDGLGQTAMRESDDIEEETAGDERAQDGGSAVEDILGRSVHAPGLRPAARRAGGQRHSLASTDARSVARGALLGSNSSTFHQPHVRIVDFHVSSSTGSTGFDGPMDSPATPSKGNMRRSGLSLALNAPA